MRGRPRAESWSDLWLAALGAAWGARLKRGAALAREGLAVDLQVRAGGAEAQVREPGGPAYRPQLAVRPLAAREWAAGAAALLWAPEVAAALDAGELPPAVAPVLAGVEAPLLPAVADLAVDCPCPERAPCRHVAALVYLLAEALAVDPWLLLLLRGRARPAFYDLLATTRAALVPDLPPEAGPPGPGNFWELAAPLDDFHCALVAPTPPAPLLRQLGPPPFWAPPAAFAAILEPLYAAVSAAVLRLVQGEADDPLDGANVQGGTRTDRPGMGP